MSKETDKRIAIIGSGLVGSLNACFLAKRGFRIDVYDKRPDMRNEEVVRGMSLNLTMSSRGRDALRHVGLENDVVDCSIPMYGRMVHELDGSTRPILYGKKDQYIMSVERRKLNEILLTATEKYANITLHFQHKFISCNFKAGEIVFEKSDGERFKTKTDLIIGCDGAYSAVRRELMKTTLMYYEQTYIEHGYLELRIPRTPDDKYAMAVNYLHLWPRNDFMMIALPNQDKSYTTTLIMPFELFKRNDTEEKLMDFFRQHFPDSIKFLGEHNLKQSYMNGSVRPVISIKCHPYHVGEHGVIMGDATHAMVPFYGQGMNAGLEDCIVFDEMLEKYDNDFSKALPAYTEMRNVDAKAICDLAMYNYIEMRQLINSPFFVPRKMLDNLLYYIFPNSWIPLYTMVSFTRTRYHQCILKREWQDQILQRVGYGFLAGGALFGCYLCRDRLQIEKTSLFGVPHWLSNRLQSVVESVHRWTK